MIQSNSYLVYIRLSSSKTYLCCIIKCKFEIHFLYLLITINFYDY